MTFIEKAKKRAVFPTTFFLENKNIFFLFFLEEVFDELFN